MLVVRIDPWPTPAAMHDASLAPETLEKGWVGR